MARREDTSRGGRPQEGGGGAADRARAVFDTMPVGVVYQDSSGVITAANPAAERILGMSLDQMQGRTSVDPRWRAMHEDGSDFPGEDHPAMVALRTGEHVAGVTMGVYNPATGRQRWIRVDATPLFDAGAPAPREVYTTFLDVTEAHTARVALSESESRFRRLFDAMSEGVAYCRMLYDDEGTPVDFVYESVNAAFAALTGLEDVVGRRVTEILPAIKEETPELFAIYGRVARTGEPARFDLDFTPLGKQLRVAVYGPEVDHFVAVFNDVTEVARATDALRRSEIDRDTLLDTIPDIAFAVDRDYRVMSANSAFVEATTTSGDRPVERGDSVFSGEYPPEFIAEWRALYDRALAGETFEAETSVPYPDGQRHMENFLSPVRGDDGVVTGVVVVSHDITARRQAVAALGESEARLRMAQDAAKAGSWEWDLRTGENVWSDEVWRLYDLEKAGLEPSYELWLESVHPDDRVAAAAMVGGAAAEGAELNAEWRVNTRDGSRRWLMSRGQPLRDDAGKVSRYRGIVIDITERKAAEEEVRRLNSDLERRVRERTAELETANQEMRGFVYSISHDLRTPLRTIGSYGQILLEEHADGLGEEGRSDLRRIVRANARMVRLVEGLLELSGLTRRQLQPDRVDVSAIAREIGAEIGDSEPQRAVELTVADGLEAVADPDLLRIVFYDLLGNAWKFTRERESAHIAVGAERVGGETAFFVRDDGAGFDPRYAGRLFTPFERLHDDARFGGTGIGLATVKRIVERHGGRVWADGELDGGATFWFTLP